MKSSVISTANQRVERITTSTLIQRWLDLCVPKISSLFQNVVSQRDPESSFNAFYLRSPPSISVQRRLPSVSDTGDANH